MPPGKNPSSEVHSLSMFITKLQPDITAACLAAGARIRNCRAAETDECGDEDCKAGSITKRRQIT